MSIRQCDSCHSLTIEDADDHAHADADADGRDTCLNCGDRLGPASPRRHAEEPAAGAFAANDDRSATVFATAAGSEIRIPAPGFTRATVPGLIFLTVWVGVITLMGFTLSGNGRLWPEGLMLLPFVLAAALIARTSIGDAVADRVVTIEPDGVSIHRARGGKPKRTIALADIAAIVPGRRGKGINVLRVTGTRTRVHRTIDGPARDRAARLIAGAVDDARRG